ncbi:MAG: sigma 54-interacting transcriptional regulator [Planctomycetes bacterium]|nr:sigma 54-interacting transcriptional regulator [Planctomycetota bacterium]
MKSTKILIVDDDPSNIAVLADILKPDFETFAAKNGTAAMKWLNLNTTPDLILLDIRMPDMDGYEVCRRIQSDSRTRDVPVIFITALDDMENEAAGLSLGAVDYIKRPFSPAIVRARVKSHIELAQSKKSSEQRYQALFSSTADGIAIYDITGRFIEVNDAFCDNTGFAREELLEMSIENIEHPPEGIQSLTQRFAALQLRNCEIFETLQVRKSGETFPVEVSARLIELNGKPAALTVCRDITQRKKTEDELKHYRQELENLLAKRTEELEKKDRTLTDLQRELKKRKRFQNIVGKSEQMQTIFTRLDELVDLPTTILVVGETGVGKDLVAEALHFGGIRRDHPLVRVACSDLTENLIESELFGHVRGAFTGASNSRTGRFAKAGKGTILLDEIGDISPLFQKRLLRVIEKRTFERVGENRSIRMEARIVAATHRDLHEMVQQGLFREDLYYRLKVVAVNLPPLRQRRGDIQLLTRHFLEEFNQELGKKIEGISEDAMSAFMEYPWPGNVRELKHAIEHASILCKGILIKRHDLPTEIREQRSVSSSFFEGFPENEASIILSTLQKTRWNKTVAARTLGMSRQTLYRKLKAFGVEDSMSWCK